MNKKASREAWYARFFYPGLIAAMIAVFLWLAQNVLFEALPFFVMAASYGALLTRVVRRSGRAFMAMYAAFLLIYYSFLAVEDDLGVPAAAPWFMGFIIGAIAGGHAWSGDRAGSQVSRKRERTTDGQGFTGGWQLALINAISAVVLLGLGVSHLIIQSPTVPVAAVLGIAVVGGWALFRFVTSVQIKYLSLFAIPVGLFVLLIVGGATDQLALPHVWAYGSLAGILVGGRYWSGPKFGEPRPPFAGQGGRRRRRKRRPKSKQKQRLDLRLDEASRRGSRSTPGTNIVRGHLVRRASALWGDTGAEAAQANEEGFHYTNAAPHAAKFDQDLKLWLGLR